ncbi:MAG: glycosyltransferase [Kiritimatiellae bacterium]|nr:glycosyltransferase [Kiritimatiellia bacterium]
MPEKKTLTCSVIINTYNRAKYLRNLLPSLDHLDGAVFEVVVVNGPSSDDTESVLAEYKGRIKHVGCPVCNLSVSRNIGIAQAAGDLVAFLDDDALPGDSSWLKRFVDAFEKDDHLAAVGGKVLVGDSEWTEYNGGLTTCYGFQHFDCSQKRSPSPDQEEWVLRVPGGNCAYHREKLIALGGFDEFYKYYADETDVCLRFFRNGDRITHLEYNPIRHYPQRVFGSNQALAKKYFVITRSDTYFAMKNATGAFWRRLARTLHYAKKKHFYPEIKSGFKKKSFSRMTYYSILSHWYFGVAAGCLAGIFWKRKTQTFSPPPPFLPFTATGADRINSPLRIALLSQTLPINKDYGGIGRYMYDLALGLHELGHEVHLFYKDNEPRRYLRLGLEAHGITKEEYSNAPSTFPNLPVLNKNTAYSTAVYHRMQKLSEQGLVFDVIHGNNWDAEGVAVLRSGAYPVILLLVTSLAQDVIEQQWDWNSDMRLSIALDHWQITHAHALCSPSSGVMDSYRSLMGIPDEVCGRTAPLPLGIVPVDPRPATPGEKQKNILFVGRCERRKGIHTLLEVLPNLLESHPQWTCDIVGNDQIPNERDRAYKDEFLEKYGTSSWISRVHFHGFVAEEELQRLYRECALFAAPSLYESFGLIYLEAMQFGKPVIGCRTGGIPEVVDDGVSGILIEPGNVTELRAALQRLMDDETLRRNMGLRGQERVYRELNYLAMADRYAQYYRDTIATHGNSCETIRQALWT